MNFLALFVGAMLIFVLVAGGGYAAFIASERRRSRARGRGH